MSGLTVIVDRNSGEISPERILDCIDPLKTFARHIKRSGECWLASAAPRNTPSATPRLTDNGRMIGLLAGDPVSDEPVDWRSILPGDAGDGVRSDLFADLHGAFALATYDAERQIVTLVTDAFGIQPVYIMQAPTGILASTALASFLQLVTPAPGVDPHWVHEYLFFNYPVLERTLLQGVRRLPAGSITTIDIKAGEVDTRPYTSPVERQESNLTRPEEVERAIALFRDIVPQWLATRGEVLFSLSGGLDSRAVLAALPESAKGSASTFTYGIAGSTEITEASAIAEAVGLRHRELFLSDRFLDLLPSLMHDTVFLSDTLQVINRSNLPLVYGSLAPADDPAPAILSGVSGDHLFRDHISAWGNVPYLISADVAAMHRSGRQRLDASFYQDMFTGNFGQIEGLFEETLDELEDAYGSFGDPEAYYRYLMYVAGSRYFGGQAAIANRFSTFRTPYWDRRLVQFAMDIELGTVGLSQQGTKKDLFIETILQASVVASNPRLRAVPYMNLPIDVFTKKSSANYQFHRVLRKAKSIMTGRSRIEEEDWPLWYETVLAEEIAELFGPDSRIKSFVKEEFINRQLQNADIHWLGKLLTAEIALRLAETGWRREVSF